MILPPGIAGVAFTEAGDGDVRNERRSRAGVSRRLGIPEGWATAGQVHGARIARVSASGETEGVDGLWTQLTELPVAVFTADCLGVVLGAVGAVGVAHAGWRGAASGVVEALANEMRAAGHTPDIALIGPGIGPCCFEVGPEVREKFAGHLGKTRWGSDSIDLEGVISEQLADIQVMTMGGCTRHDERFFSHRRDSTPKRMAAIAWRV